MSSDIPGQFSKIMSIGLGIILVIICAFIVALISYAVSYSSNLFTSALVQGTPTDSNVTNVSYYAALTFGNVNSGISQFRWMSFVIIFGLIMGCMISFFMVRLHPAWSFLYIMVASACWMLSIFISRAYENIYTSGTDFGNGLAGWVGSSWLLLNLPVVVVTMSLLGAIPLFINLVRDRDDVYG